MPAPLTRRAFVAGAAIGSVSVFVKPLRAPAFAEGFGASRRSSNEQGERRRADYTFTQFHNQTATSSLHRRLVEMWAAIRTETRGRVETQVFAQNNRLAGSDPAALNMLVAGEIQFFTLMGGILGTVVPAAEIQQVPFAFRSAAHAHKAMDGALGGFLREEMAAKGIFGFPAGTFDNGKRTVAVTKYVRLQRLDQERMNARLRTGLAGRGLMFNDVAPGPFRDKLSGVYGTWKERLGTRGWSLLEAATRT